MHAALRIVLLSMLAFLWTGLASATTIDPLHFEELVLGADFVGVVECEKAGGIVAEYKVIESWKGPKAGSRVSLRVAVNYWQPQFPITLCGERYFVTAYTEPPSRIVSTTSGGGVPLWWRNIPADYRLPLFQGRELLKTGEEKDPDFEKKRKAAQTLLALKPAEQEAALLKALVPKDLLGKRYVGGEPDEARAKKVAARFAELASADAVVAEMIRLAKEEPEKWAARARIVLGKGGGTATLDRLEKLPADESPWKDREREALLKGIKSRLEGAKVKRPPEAEKETVPSDERLAELRKALAAGPDHADFGDAFETLPRYDPGPVAEFLVAWKNADKDWRDADRGYVLGSYFAWRCGKERTKHLKALLAAKDPSIRVAGAVYHYFEDSEAGMAELKKLTALEGDPGVWAVLTLARRGQKTAVPRILEVFKEPEGAGMAGVPHGNLQKRVLVLLSNSARAGGAPQPPVPRDEGPHGDARDALVQWWKQHGDKVVLTDPWLKMLEKQKVD